MVECTSWDGGSFLRPQFSECAKPCSCHWGPGSAAGHSHRHGVLFQHKLLLSPRFSLCLSSAWPVRLVTGPVGMDLWACSGPSSFLFPSLLGKFWILSWIFAFHSWMDLKA